ncbi:uncharacterized protein F5Z01DRAFT_645319 [Emericellopsis atlantica]|uniref:Uncharacterized protein n=1 Tax=Emericellopsis atlantica TaxID=2614577 RepID=A0A9P7ZTV4_9HYPO|nr:uncharacterized protein F5Z01DRAFT_645319 [Emericellopsis atlantica]KAG9258160.1 hypothetical protein F5Z01DRAFT_645319 [Emericellopsis atlantica]
MSVNPAELYKRFNKEPAEQQELREKNGFRRASAPSSNEILPSLLASLKSHRLRGSKQKRKAEEPHNEAQEASPRPNKQQKAIQNTQIPSSSPERLIPWSSSPVGTRPPPSGEGRFDLRAAPNFSLPPSSVGNNEEEYITHDEVESILHSEEYMQSQVLDLPRTSPARTSPVTQSTPDRSRLAGTPTCAQPSQQVVPGTVLVSNIPASSLPVGKGTQSRERPERPQTRPRRMKLFKPEVLDNSKIRKDHISPTRHSSPGDASIEQQEEVQGPQAAMRRGTGDVVIAKDNLQSQDVRLSPARSAIPELVVTDPDTKRASQASAITLTEFEAFVDKYPEYTVDGGTLSTFLKACITLEWARKYQKLHHFLWDDFIRVYTTLYLPYVKNQGGTRGAVEFYNDRTEAPLWVPSQMVKASTLDRILDFYRDRVRELRARMIVDKDNGGQPLGPSPEDNTLTKASKPGTAAPTTPIREQQPGRRHTMGPLPAPNRSREAVSTPVPSAEPSSSRSTPMSQLPYFRNLMQKGTPKRGNTMGQNVYRKMVQRKSTGSLPGPSV